MTQACLKKDAAIVAVLQRFERGEIDLQEAALKILRLKERQVGLPFPSDEFDRYIEKNRVIFHSRELQRDGSEQYIRMSVEYIIVLHDEPSPPFSAYYNPTTGELKRRW